MKSSTLLFVLLLSTNVFSQELARTFKEKEHKSEQIVVPQKIKAERIDGSKNVEQNKALLSSSNFLSLRAKIVRDSAGLPIYVEYHKKLATSANGRAAMTTAAVSYLNDLKSVLNIKNPSDEVSLETYEEDELNFTHLRLQQRYKGIAVYGGEYILHAQNGELQTLNGRFYPTPIIDDIASHISENEAIGISKSILTKETIVRNLTENEKQFIKKHTPETELVIFHINEDPTQERLAWRITIRPNFVERWNVVIDAKTGELIQKNNHTCAIDGPARATATDLNGTRQNINVYLKGSTYYLLDVSRPMYKTTSVLPNQPVGTIWTVDARNSTADDISIAQIGSTSLNTWTTTAVSAHYNAGIAYDYFTTKHSRNSLDGKGGNIVSVINIKDENGKEMGNAFWNGEIMGYGNGDSYFKPLAGGLDVAAHEMTHGVIENTANLDYYGQSGAINESIADVFGVLVDRANWTIGETVVKAGFPSGSLRNLANPNQGGSNDPGYQPRTMNQYVNTTEDEGGVHINSGIPNYAFYLFANNASVGKDKAEKVYYRALTNYLTRTSKFLQLRLAIIKSAADLYGATSAEVTAAKSAFDAVGILDTSGGGTTNPTPNTPSTTIPQNNGTDGILVYGSDDKLYSTTPAATTLTTKVSRKIINKPSITDDGQYAYYVSSDNKIRSVTLIGTPTETVISDETIWDNVAVSKDGKKLAAITNSADKTIYVYSYDRKEWKEFTLYNPTYTKGVSTGEVQYADALEWDQSGEYLVYDAFSKLKSSTGEVIDYWDVGFIKVWNSSAASFGDGTIQKLYTNLEKGESIGNPSFAKNTPSVIAFDYFKEDENLYYVLADDLDDSDPQSLKIVYKNNVLGTPNYSRLDDKMLFVTKISNINNVVTIGLSANKRTPTSTTTSALVKNATWPIWYAQGTRTLPTITFNTIADKLMGTAPFNITATHSGGLAVLFKVISGPATMNGTIVTITGVGTVVIRAYSEGNSRFYPATSVDRTFQVIPLLSVATAIEVVAFPNPTTGEMLIEGIDTKTIKNITIIDNAGRQVLSPRFSKQSTGLSIDLNNLQIGSYLLQIETENKVVRRKILKK